MTTNTNDTPRIYVASLSDYNNGILHGVWIDVSGKDAEDIQGEIYTMLEASPSAARYGEQAEEWAIHDHEGFYGLLEENDSIGRAVELAGILEEHGEAYAKYLEYFGSHWGTVADFEERYLGEWDSEREYAENLVEDLGLLAGVPDTLARYFDIDAYAHDLFLGEYVFLDGYVFITC